MPWPSPADYSAAIQNPQNNLADPELKAGQVTNNQLGLPLGASGNFAVVYKVQAGVRMFAVRCFIRPVTDQEQRYHALSQHLSAFWLSSLVDFAYLPQGIRVRGEWYPIVRMEWIPSKQLNQYVEACLREGQGLGRLAAQWRGVLAGLSGSHTAHGDLQHGNILVDGQGQIRLVDYDGFFLPTLRERPPGEVGHPNYQHPNRIRQGYYGENADTFSALVIYLSLLALKADPGLWIFHNGDNLIFVADDFNDPGRTSVWGRLKQSPDVQVQWLTATLHGFCWRSVAQLPDMEAVLQEMPGSTAPPLSRSAPTPVSAPAASVTPPHPAPVKRDHLPNLPPSVSAAGVTPSSQPSGADIFHDLSSSLEEAVFGAEKVIVVEQRRLAVKIPPGVQTGTKIRLARMGKPGPRGAAPGNLYVVIKVGAHPVFSQVGADLHIRLPITREFAATGGTVRVPQLRKGNSFYLLTIPPNTQNGTVLKIAKQGGRAHKGAPPGDLCVTIETYDPHTASPAIEKQLRLIKQALHGQDLNIGNAPPAASGQQPPATFTCPRCGRVNPIDEIYCQSCTYQLSVNRPCPHCRASVPVKATHCPKCGRIL